MNHRKTVANWLYFSAFMVFAMAIIGAITRLSESGLSMVEWRPLIGAAPPLNEGEWQRVFALYRETPEYQLKNAGMELSQFKSIFFWEWFHRLWGRLIGLAYALPLLFFWLRGMVPKGWGLPLIALLVLGGMQGVMGWYMVESGLVDRPSVSHFRLAAHLSLAAVIFCLLIYVGTSIRDPQARPRLTAMTLIGFIATGVTFIWGAFVAGLDAGMVYNSFPHMGQGRLIPEEFSLSPHSHIWMILHDPVAVQFMHRWLAVATVCYLGFMAWRMKYWALAAMAVTQMTLGIATLLSLVWIPLATLHQAGAFITLGLLVLALFRGSCCDAANGSVNSSCAPDRVQSQ